MSDERSTRSPLTSPWSVKASSVFSGIVAFLTPVDAQSGRWIWGALRAQCVPARTGEDLLEGRESEARFRQAGHAANGQCLGGPDLFSNRLPASVSTRETKKLATELIPTSAISLAGLRQAVEVGVRHGISRRAPRGASTSTRPVTTRSRFAWPVSGPGLLLSVYLAAGFVSSIPSSCRSAGPRREHPTSRRRSTWTASRPRSSVVSDLLAPRTE